MLDFIRNNKRLTQIILLVFIIPSFIFVGIEGYKRLGDTDSVAKVAGKSITKQEWENAQREQAEMLRVRAAQTGQPFDSKWIESPKFKWAVLQNLVTRRALLHALNKEYLNVPEHVVLEHIRRIPGLVGEDGKINEKAYKAMLTQRGLTPEDHFALIAQDLTMQQLAAPIEVSSYQPKTVVNRVWNLFVQEREVQRKVFDTKAYMSRVTVTPEEEQAFYKSHRAEFTIPEHADVEYVVLDVTAAEKTVSITPADLNAYYTQNKERFAIPEERRAKHILIAFPQDVSPSAKKSIRERAEDLLMQIRAEPGRFAEFAKKHSQDPGSAANGGDLGFFTRGKMVKEFNDAVFSMQKGAISDLVETEYGFHIVSVTDIKPAVYKPFAQVKDSVYKELRRAQVSKKFTEMSETFSNMVYEKPDSLQPVASALKLEVKSIKNLAKDPETAERQHPIGKNSKLMTALFSDDSVKGKHNTEPAEVAPQVFVSARIAKHYPATLIPFEQVAAKIKAAVTAEKALALAKSDGEKELAELKNGGDAKGFSPAIRVSRKSISMSGRGDMAPIMKVDVSKLPAYTGAEVAPHGYVIYRVTKVVQPTTEDKNLKQLMGAQMARILIQQDMTAYLNHLKERAGVEILVKSPEEEAKEAAAAAAAPAPEKK